MSKKLYTATIEFQFVVLAEDAHEAMRLAEQHADDELRSIGGAKDAGAYVAETLIRNGKPSLPEGWEMDLRPYGSDKTIAELMTAAKEET